MLLPKLEKAVEKDGETRLMTVIAAGRGGTIHDMNDLGLTKGSSVKTKAEAATVYNDSMIEVSSITPLLTSRNLLNAIPRWGSYMRFPVWSTHNSFANCHSICAFRTFLFEYLT
jgi:hypothetical protein